MRARLSVAVALAALLAAPAPVVSPAQAPAPEVPPVFSTGAQAVVLDIVARDKKGRTVGDLRAEEVEVFEEGQPKAIVSFRFVEKGPAPPAALPGAPAAPGSAPSPEAIRHPTLVTLVFDALDEEGRVFARSAAQELLKTEDRPDLLFSVFHIGNRLQLLQQFTPDRAAVAAAVDRACSVLDPRGAVPGAEAEDRATAAAEAANARAQAAGDAAMAGGGGAAGGRPPARPPRRRRWRTWSCARSRWRGASSAASGATPRSSASSRSPASSSGSPAARPSCTSPRASRSPTSWSPSTAPW